jgi:hypothetical protein
MADFDNTNRGVLFINDRKQTEKHPDYKGSINVGGQEFWLSAWMKPGSKGDFISLSVEPKEAKQDSPASAAKPLPKSAPAKDMDDSIPF